MTRIECEECRQLLSTFKLTRCEVCGAWCCAHCIKRAGFFLLCSSCAETYNDAQGDHDHE